MKKVFVLLNALIIATVFNFSCSKFDSIESTESLSSLQVTLPGSASQTRAVYYTKADTAKYEIVITNREKDFTFSKEAIPGQTILFNKIPEGFYDVDVYAYEGSEGYVCAYGESKNVNCTNYSTAKTVVSMYPSSHYDLFISTENSAWKTSPSSYLPGASYSNLSKKVRFANYTSEAAWSTPEKPTYDNVTKVKIIDNSTDYIYLNSLKYQEPYVQGDATNTAPINQYVGVAFTVKAEKNTIVRFMLHDVKNQKCAQVYDIPVTTIAQRFYLSAARPFYINDYQSYTYTGGNEGPWGAMFRALITKDNGEITIQDFDMVIGGDEESVKNQITNAYDLPEYNDRYTVYPMNSSNQIMKISSSDATTGADGSTSGDYGADTMGGSADFVGTNFIVKNTNQYIGLTNVVGSDFSSNQGDGTDNGADDGTKKFTLSFSEIPFDSCNITVCAIDKNGTIHTGNTYTAKKVTEAGSTDPTIKMYKGEQETTRNQLDLPSGLGSTVDDLFAILLKFDKLGVYKVSEFNPY